MKTRKTLLALCSVLAVGAISAASIAYTVDDQATATADGETWLSQQTVTNIESASSTGWSVHFDGATVTDMTADSSTRRLYVTKSTTYDNLNQYDGNISIYPSCWFASFALPGVTDDNTLLSFRTNYIDLTGNVFMDLMARGVYTFSSSEPGIFSGYLIRMQNEALYFYGNDAKRDTLSGRNVSASSSGADGYFSLADLEGSQDDSLIVTYGAIDIDTDADNVLDAVRLYANVYNEDTQKNVEAYVDFAYGTNTITTATDTDGTIDTFAFRMRNNGWKDQANGYLHSFSLAGIERPVLSSEGYTVKDGVAEGTKLSNVAIPSNYTFTDPDATVKYGTNTYAANFEYYGNTYTTTVTITGTVDIAEWAAEQKHIDIEDNISNVEQLLIRNNANGQKVTASSTLNSSETPAVENLCLYTDAATDATAAYNANDYAGNLSFYLKSGYGVMTVPNGTESNYNSLMTFKTKWLGNVDNTWLDMMTRGNYFDSEAWMANMFHGYSIRLFGRNLYFYGNDTTLSGAASVKNGTPDYKTDTISSSVLSADDKLTITYGAVNVTDDTVRLYIKIYNDTKNVTTIETFYDFTGNTITTNSAAANITFALRYRNNAYKDATAKTFYPLTIAGNNEPILFTTPSHTDNNEYDEAEYSTLADIALPDGWTWDDESTALVYGTNSYPATYTLNYYGKTITSQQNVSLKVTGDRLVVTYVDAEGVTLKEDAVAVGAKLALADYDNPYAQTVGWFVGDNLYPVGYEITVNEATTVTLAEIDLSIDDAISIRTNTEEGYNYGMRFLAKVDATQLAALGDRVTFNGMVAPTDAISDQFVVGMSGAHSTTQLVNTTTVDGDVCGYITFTNILYENFNRQFSARAYVVVTFDDDSTATFYSAYDETVNAVSVLDLVKASIKDEVITGDTASEIFSYYVDSVVELVYDPTDNSFAVVDYQDGYEFTRTYTVEETTLDGANNSATLKIAITIPADLYEAGATPNIPVLVYNADGTLVNGTATIVGYVDGVAEITLTLEG